MEKQDIPQEINYERIKELEKENKIIYFRPNDYLNKIELSKREINFLVFPKKEDCSYALINGNKYERTGTKDFKYILEKENFCKQDKNSLVDKLKGQ